MVYLDLLLLHLHYMLEILKLVVHKVEEQLLVLKEFIMLNRVLVHVLLLERVNLEYLMELL